MDWSLICILGVSWAWKNTMLRLLLENHKDFMQALSTKTRPLRVWEKNGVDYYYLTDDEFHEAIDNNEFLEYAQVHEKYLYGTNKQEINKMLQNGRVILKEIDVQWLENIIKNHADMRQKMFSIFLNLSDATMIKRITARTTISEDDLQNRLKSALWERDVAKKYCDIILSWEGSIDEVYQRVDACIIQYLSNMHNQKTQ